MNKSKTTQKQKNRIKFKSSLLYIILCAFLTIFLLRFLEAVSLQDKNVAESMVVNEVDGVYDLTEENELNEREIILPHGQKYYPSALIEPADISESIAVEVDRFDSIAANYLTQTFCVLVPDDSQIYQMELSLSLKHAMRVYVNGELVKESGKVSALKEESEVYENHISFYATPKDGQIDVVLQSVQLYNAKGGASLAELHISSMSTTPDGSLGINEKGILIIGILFCAIAILICIFFYGAAGRGTLYFAIACVAMIMREFVLSEVWTTVDHIVDGNTAFAMEYFSVPFLTCFMTLYLFEFLGKSRIRILGYIAIGASVIYGTCVIFTDSLFYTGILRIYQIILVICIIPGITWVALKVKENDKEKIVALYGILVFFLAAVHDIVMYNGIIFHIHPKRPISELAMIVFVLAETISLLLRNGRRMAEIKEREAVTRAEKESLEKVNQMKTEFLGNISHELKTPLTVVNSHIQFVKSNMPKSDQEEIARSMNLIDAETSRMAMLITQLLDVSRIDEGRMFIQKNKISLVTVVQETLETYYPVFTKNHNTIQIKREGLIPNIDADKNRIIQVLMNVITNASKHTRNGSIIIRISANEEEAKVVISDNGEGMSKEQQDNLFNRYYTSGKTIEEKDTKSGINTGTGLGLYICKHIMELHGGKIGIESEKGKGTEVTLTFPIDID